MAIRFEDVEEGQGVFLPGVQQMGRVLQVLKMGRRTHQVVVRLGNETEVTYRKNQWFAVHPDDAPKAARANSRVPEVVGAGVRVDVTPKRPQPKQRKPFGPDKRQAPKSPPAQRNKAWPTTLPDIPGPPVPKPIAGVWSDEIEEMRRDSQTA